MRDEVEALQRLRRAARAHATAVTAMVEFVERSSAVLDPGQLAEYEALLARESPPTRSARTRSTSLASRPGLERSRWYTGTACPTPGHTSPVGAEVTVIPAERLVG
jgi:hypothetical protein